MELTLKNNIKTIYWMFFFQSFMIVIAVFVPLLQRHGLTMSEVLQTQALFAFVIAVFEVPSGYLADLWGRKNTIIIGQGLMALGYLYLLQANSFPDFLVYEGLMGLGISLSSGADLALLYDTQAALSAQGKAGTAPGKHISRLVALEGYGGAASGLSASFLTLLGPLLGYLVDSHGVNTTLIMLAVVMLPIVLTVLYNLSLHVQEESKRTAQEEEKKKQEAETSVNETLTA